MGRWEAKTNLNPIGGLLRRLLGLLDAARTNYLWSPRSTTGIVQLLEAWADQRPDDPYLVFETSSFSIGRFEQLAEAHAQAYARLGVVEGDVVALALENRPAFLFHFYGLLKLGAVAALLNPRLRDAPLAHALSTANAKLVVCEAPLAAPLEIASQQLEAPPRLFVDGQELASPVDPVCLKGACWRVTSPEPRPKRRPLPLSATAAYVYTSGTTGLPKAGVVKHHRLFRAGRIFGAFAGAGRGQGLYLSLPLYHGNATIIAVPLTLAHRTRLILARRFSARRFFADCAEHEATLAMYIGELCRYLLATPPGPTDRSHGVRCVFGNGLRPALWRPFRERFGVEQILEFYAATEGNAETINMLGVEGSCGPLLVGKMALARYDESREELARDRRGLCHHARAGEPGLLLGAISDRNDFAGYTDREATSRKVLRDVFKRGDAWFDTGDLLRRDHLRHLYFIDRLGDTFRWKGENVATGEVEQALAARHEVALCAVYGVQVGEREGRCGMATVQLAPQASFDGAAFFTHLAARLPEYAQPRFIRLVVKLELTDSFKLKKRTLREAGFDPQTIADPLFLRDPIAARYVPLDEARHADVLAGRWKL